MVGFEAHEGHVLAPEVAEHAEGVPCMSATNIFFENFNGSRTPLLPLPILVALNLKSKLLADSSRQPFNYEGRKWIMHEQFKVQNVKKGRK